MSTEWLHVDIRRVNHGVWRGYVTELEEFVSGVTRHTVQQEARRVIEETAGLKEYQVVWNDC